MYWKKQKQKAIQEEEDDICIYIYIYININVNDDVDEMSVNLVVPFLRIDYKAWGKRTLQRGSLG